MKKALSVILTAAILAAVLCVGTAGASAMTPGMLNTYTPPAGLQTQRVMFAMPGAWLNEYTQAHTDNVVGIYWWTGIDAPSALDTMDNSHGNWPGYKADKMEEPGVDNLWYCDIAAYTPYDGNTNNDITHIVWNNYVLCDPDDLYHPNQTEDIFIEFWAESLNNHFSHLFGNTEVEWGSYADNYFYDAEYGNCLTLDNMVYVIEPGAYGWNYWVDRDTWLGRFYFYYGGGDYGVWPTKAQNTAMNGAGGNFMTDDYYQSIYRTPDNPTNPTNPTDPTVPTQLAFDPDTHYCTGEHNLAYEVVAPTCDKQGFTRLYCQACPYEVHYDFTPATGAHTYTGAEEITYASGETVTVGGYCSQCGAAGPRTPAWEQRSDQKIYFDANTLSAYADTEIGNCYLFLFSDSGDILLPWENTAQTALQYDNTLHCAYFDCSGLTLQEGAHYCVIVHTARGQQTSDIVFGTECFGDLLYCTGMRVENSVDGNQYTFDAVWANADPDKYNARKQVTSIGHVIGRAFYEGQTAESVFADYLSKGDTPGGVYYPLRYGIYNSVQQSADTVAGLLGVGIAEAAQLAAQYGITDWNAADSVLRGSDAYTRAAGVSCMLSVLDAGYRNNTNTITKVTAAMKALKVTRTMTREAVTNSNFAEAEKTALLALLRNSKGYVLTGDADGDDVVSINDATLMQSYLAENTDSNGAPVIDITKEEALRILDANKDGKINIKDVTEMQRFAAELIGDLDIIG